MLNQCISDTPNPNAYGTKQVGRRSARKPNLKETNPSKSTEIWLQSINYYEG